LAFGIARTDLVPVGAVIFFAGRSREFGSDQIETWLAVLHEGLAFPTMRNSQRTLSSLSVMSARLRLHGVSSYGRSRRPKPFARDNFMEWPPLLPAL
jgi:hypothetical protein